MVTKTVFLFPGQGSQSIGMGRASYEASPLSRKLFEEADHILGFSISKIMFEGPEEKLRETSITQPALFLASAAGFELLKQRGIHPSWVAGHSLGEYSALYAAGATTFSDTMKLVQARGRAMQDAGQATPGSMAAVIGFDSTKLQEICQEVSSRGEVCVIANLNSESQIVISGTRQGVEQVGEKAKSAGASKVILLNVSGAFHSPLMASAVNKMKPLIENTRFSDASIPVVANVDAKPSTDANQFKVKLIQQIDHSVLWNDSLKTLLNYNPDLFIEVGSGQVLSAMIKKLDRKKFVFCTDEIDQLDKHLSVAHPK